MTRTDRGPGYLRRGSVENLQPLLWRDHRGARNPGAARLCRARRRTNFRWLRLNQWISTKDVGWPLPTLWRQDADTGPPSAKAERDAGYRSNLIGKTCCGGLDLSATTDRTALALTFSPGRVRYLRPGARWTAYWRRQTRTRPIPGLGAGRLPDALPRGMIDYTMVEQAACEAGAATPAVRALTCLASRTLVSRLTSPVNDAGEEKPCVRH